MKFALAIDLEMPYLNGTFGKNLTHLGNKRVLIYLHPLSCFFIISQGRDIAYHTSPRILKGVAKLKTI